MTKTRYIISTNVIGTRKVGEAWFILFEGSQEWLGLGKEEPELKKGDRVKITISKIGEA